MTRRSRWRSRRTTRTRRDGAGRRAALQAADWAGFAGNFEGTGRSSEAVRGAVYRAAAGAAEAAAPAPARAHGGQAGSMSTGWTSEFPAAPAPRRPAARRVGCEGADVDARKSTLCAEVESAGRGLCNNSTSYLSSLICHSAKHRNPSSSSYICARSARGYMPNIPAKINPLQRLRKRAHPPGRSGTSPRPSPAPAASSPSPRTASRAASAARRARVRLVGGACTGGSATGSAAASSSAAQSIAFQSELGRALLERVERGGRLVGRRTATASSSWAGRPPWKRWWRSGSRSRARSARRAVDGAKVEVEGHHVRRVFLHDEAVAANSPLPLAP